MRRYISIVAATLMLLILASANILPPASLANPMTGFSLEESEPLAQASMSRGDNIKVFFHGLMVGRYKPGKKRFEVGIVKDATGHNFKFQICDDYGTVRDIWLPETPEIYEFEVVHNDESPTVGVANLYLPQGGSFDRENHEYVKDYDLCKDFRYVPDIEGDGLHNKKEKRKSKAFKHVFHVLKGTVMSKCLTNEYVQKKKIPEPPNAWKDYGYIAEIVGVDITLSPNQKLVLRRKDNHKVVWTCWYAQGKNVEARVLHLPIKKNDSEATDVRACDYIKQACVVETGPNPTEPPPVSHFQLYYDRAINVDEDDRYDLKSSLVRRQASRAGDASPRTIYPYKCGMLRQGKTDNDIDEDDIDDQM